MPIFEFKCRNCGKLFEVLFMSRDEKPDIRCPACSSKKSDKVLSVFSGKVENTSLPADPCSSCSKEFT